MAQKDLFVGSLNDIYGKFLSKKQSRIISAYFDEDLSLAEIAENEGITRQAVLDLIRRTSQKLYGWEKECGYCKAVSNLRNLKEKADMGDKSALSEILDIIGDF